MSANFSFTTIGPWQVQFTDTSSPPATFWAWDFGDGSPISNVQNPVHEYVHGPEHVYEVTLQIDPFDALVVSLMRFPDAVACDGTHVQSLEVDGDEKGVEWVLQSNQSTSSVTPPVLALDQYADPANPHGGASVLFSVGRPSFIADGDLTIEFTHNSVISNNNYGGGTQIVILSAVASVFDIGPSHAGEWALSYQKIGGGAAIGKILFTMKTATGFVQATINGIDGFPYPLIQDNIGALQRRSGIWEVWIGGEKVMHQFNPSDNTPTINFITMGGTSTGCAFNNYGSGDFTNFRYTVGVARYTAPYDVPVDFDTEITLPVDVSGPFVPPEPVLGPPPQLPKPYLPLERIVKVTPNYS